MIGLGVDLTIANRFLLRRNDKVFIMKNLRNKPLTMINEPLTRPIIILGIPYKKEGICQFYERRLTTQSIDH